MKTKILLSGIAMAMIMVGCGDKSEVVTPAEQGAKVEQSKSAAQTQEQKLEQAQEKYTPLSKEEAYGTMSKAEEQLMSKAGICEPRFDEKAPGGIASIKCGAEVGYDFDDEYDAAVREAQVKSQRKIAEALKNRLISNTLSDTMGKKGVEDILVGDEQQRQAKMQQMKQFADRIEAHADSVMVGVLPLAQGEYMRGNKKYVYVISGVNFSTLEFFNELGKRTEQGLRDRGYNPYTGEGIGDGSEARDSFRGNYQETQRDLPQAPTEMKSRSYYDF